LRVWTDPVSRSGQSSDGGTGGDGQDLVDFADAELTVRRLRLRLGRTRAGIASALHGDRVRAAVLIGNTIRTRSSRAAIVSAAERNIWYQYTNTGRPRRASGEPPAFCRYL
jgi:hypothetical protein